MSHTRRGTVRFHFANQRTSSLLLFGAALLGVTALPQSGAAQVVYSLGVQEVYDDNIFLESGQTPKLPPAGSESTPFVLTPDTDGLTNDDMITNISIGVSGALPISPHVKSSAGVKTGFLIFAEEDSENRMTLDTALEFKAEQSLVPDPFDVSLSSRINSGSGRVSVAEGTASRQSESHDATLSFGVRPLNLSQSATIDARYALARHDFLGEFLFKSTDDLDENVSSVTNGKGRLEEEGANYYTNTLSSSIKYAVSTEAFLFLDNTVNYQTYTSSKTTDLFGVQHGEDDRLNYRPSLGVNYLLSQELLAVASVGLDLTKYSSTPEPRTISVVEEDGSITTFEQTPSDTETSLFYSAALNYFPSKDLSFSLAADQSAGTDLDGDRVLISSVSLNGSYQVFEKLAAGAGGRYSQFNNGDSLSGATERFEGSAFLRYTLAPTWAVSAGYNYTQQNQGQDSTGVFFRDGDYESNRVFISLDTGFVGLAG